MNREAALAIASVVLIVLAPIGMVAFAQSLSTHSATAGTTYQTNDGLTVTLTDPRDVEASPFDGDGTFKDANLTLSSPGSGEISIGDNAYSGDPVTVTDVQADNPITVNRTDLNREFTIESGDVTTLQVREYAVDNDTEDFAYASNNGFTITLSGLPSQGIAVVDRSSGDVLDSAAVGTTEDTATFELPAGTRSIELQSVPSELQVRNEAQPDQLVDDNVSLRARFFAEGDTVIERQVENGTVSLDGLPADEEIVVTVKESNANFTYRRILLDSIVDTSEIYILPTTEPAAEIRFEINDQTGRFPNEETRLYVEKPITRNNNTEYRVISGDRVGADGQFPTILIDSERYRLRVENTDGEQRVLGSYTVQGAEVAPIPIGEVEFSADVSEGAAMQASIREAADGAAHNHEARIVYVDPEGKTDEITISIENETGASIRPTTTEQLNGSTNVYVETYPLPTSFDPEANTATVTIDATRDMQTETFERTIGDVPDAFEGAPIDP
ncbi:MAG: hypothetical protein RI560_11090, partial [Natronomonas sp.]|nr:hypothetical protein [Natronomonas sp.]